MRRSICAFAGSSVSRKTARFAFKSFRSLASSAFAMASIQSASRCGVAASSAAIRARMSESFVVMCSRRSCSPRVSISSRAAAARRRCSVASASKVASSSGSACSHSFIERNWRHSDSSSCTSSLASHSSQSVWPSDLRHSAITASVDASASGCANTANSPPTQAGSSARAATPFSSSRRPSKVASAAR